MQTKSQKKRNTMSIPEPFSQHIHTGSSRLCNFLKKIQVTEYCVRGISKYPATSLIRMCCYRILHDIMVLQTVISNAKNAYIHSLLILFATLPSFFDQKLFSCSFRFFPISPIRMKRLENCETGTCLNFLECFSRYRRTHKRLIPH